ncbi:hypothetical protein M427DRAFT_314520 [Gonapodya prolifera JEL478]|uniref:Cell wall-active antibiotics response LiaF-like C-terminal domain-containing protein n=1 Tax=Gonapodya prolifera (strain JEL478) TaxID=1344416 RepID=A0A139AXS9_GONPJ|nr:hypothetical protein M427DRAFT_314520 [Gonapodya prolifera JEL478]|eukprot:KXS21255.1 hypothetical protein M427DRAFT_314520 [Gonapodya prolifera JEL478]
MASPKDDLPPPYSESGDRAVLVFRTPTSLMDSPSAAEVFATSGQASSAASPALAHRSAPTVSAGAGAGAGAERSDVVGGVPGQGGQRSVLEGGEPAQGQVLAAPPNSDSRTLVALFSGAEARFRGRVIPRRIFATALFGGVEIDLRGGILQPGITEIECYAMMGGISVAVGLNMDVNVEGSAIFGGFDDARDPNELQKYAQAMSGLNSGVAAEKDPPQPPDAMVVVKGLVAFGGTSVMLKFN